MGNSALINNFIALLPILFWSQSDNILLNHNVVILYRLALWMRLKPLQSILLFSKYTTNYGQLVLLNWECAVLWLVLAFLPFWYCFNLSLCLLLRKHNSCSCGKFFCIRFLVPVAPILLSPTWNMVYPFLMIWD